MYVTQCVVLKKSDANEADMVFNLYTKNYGKIRAFTQGIKKEGAKLKGHLETGSLSEIRFVAGKTGERLTHAELLRFGENMRGEFIKIQALSFILNMYDRHCMEGEPDPELWNLLEGTLFNLESVENTEIKNFLKNFETVFFTILGVSAESQRQNGAVLSGFFKGPLGL